jgi:hypothetical protein
MDKKRCIEMRKFAEYQKQSIKTSFDALTDPTEIRRGRAMMLYITNGLDETIRKCKEREKELKKESENIKN